MAIRDVFERYRVLRMKKLLLGINKKKRQNISMVAGTMSESKINRTEVYFVGKVKKHISTDFSKVVRVSAIFNYSK